MGRALRQWGVPDAPDDTPHPGRLDDLIESVTDAFYAVDREWRVVVFNRAAEAFFLLKREEVLGRGLWDIFPEGRDRPFGQACLGAMERGEVHGMANSWASVKSVMTQKLEKKELIPVTVKVGKTEKAIQAKSI